MCLSWAVKLPVYVLPVVYPWKGSSIPVDYIVEHAAQAALPRSAAAFLNEAIHAGF